MLPDGILKAWTAYVLIVNAIITAMIIVDICKPIDFITVVLKLVLIIKMASIRPEIDKMRSNTILFSLKYVRPMGIIWKTIPIRESIKHVTRAFLNVIFSILNTFPSINQISGVKTKTDAAKKMRTINNNNIFLPYNEKLTCRVGAPA
jgi:hypothetical protein